MKRRRLAKAGEYRTLVMLVGDAESPLESLMLPMLPQQLGTERVDHSTFHQVGGLPEVVQSAKKGQRYVASAWVRSTAPGQPVTIRLVGGGKESSRTTATTLPGLEWRRVIVAHTVATAGPLRLEIVGEPVPAGDSLLVDEVVVRTG